MHVDADSSGFAGNAPAQTAPAGIRVSGEVMAAHILTRPDPEYPVAAKKAKIQGTVVLAVDISEAGMLEAAQVVSGPEDLRAATLDSVRQWTYKPFF